MLFFVGKKSYFEDVQTDSIENYAQLSGDLRVPPQHTMNGTVFSMEDRHCTHFFISCPQPASKEL